MVCKRREWKNGKSDLFDYYPLLNKHAQLIMKRKNIFFIFLFFSWTQVKKYGPVPLGKNTGNQWNLETVFRPENLRIFSGDFRQETLVNHPEKFENFPVRLLLPCSVKFWSFSARSGDFSASSWRIPETGIIDLRSFSNFIFVIFNCCFEI